MNHLYEAGPDANIKRWSRNLSDLKEGFKRYDLWLLIAIQDVGLRYRSSIIGPLWITIGMGIFILFFSAIGSAIFNVDKETYLLYFSSGIIVWTLISSSIGEGTISFSIYRDILSQPQIPNSTILFRVVSKNLVIFVHNFVIFVCVYLYLQPDYIPLYFAFASGLLILLIFLFSLITIFSILSAKYRDIPEMITSVLQISFFVTPVMWRPEILIDKGKAIYTDINPLFHFISIIREPLLGTYPSTLNWLVSIVITLFVLAAAIAVYSRYAHRPIYWV